MNKAEHNEHLAIVKALQPLKLKSECKHLDTFLEVIDRGLWGTVADFQPTLELLGSRPDSEITNETSRDIKDAALSILEVLYETNRLRDERITVLCVHGSNDMLSVKEHDELQELVAIQKLGEK
jgi:hypothetical protein